MATLIEIRFGVDLIELARRWQPLELPSVRITIYQSGPMTEHHLILTGPLYCLPKPGATDDPLLPADTLIRDLWRVDDYDDLGFSWRFLTSVDGGATWEVFDTMWDDGEPFPVELAD